MTRNTRPLGFGLVVAGVGLAVMAVPAMAFQAPGYVDITTQGNGTATGPANIIYGNLPADFQPMRGSEAFQGLGGPFAAVDQLDGQQIRGGGLFNGNLQVQAGPGKDTFTVAGQGGGEVNFDDIPRPPAPRPAPPFTPLVQPTLNQIGGQPGQATIPQTLFAPQLADSVPPNAPVQADQNALRFSHFKCYQVVRRTKFSQKRVDLHDQFNRYRNVRAVRALEVCNPVLKRHNGRTTQVTDTREHLVVYRVKARPALQLQLTTRNQFGTQRIENRNLTALLVPSRKQRVAGPGNRLNRRSDRRQLDHFACYPARATAGRPAGRVILADQFERKAHRLGILNGICNPTQKVHRRKTTPLRHADSHLVSIQLRQQRSRVRGVVVRNQFGIQGFVTRNATRLLVPSTKRICTTIGADVNVPIVGSQGQQIDLLRSFSFQPYGGDPAGACPTVR